MARNQRFSCELQKVEQRGPYLGAEHVVGLLRRPHDDGNLVSLPDDVEKLFGNVVLAVVVLKGEVEQVAAIGGMLNKICGRRGMNSFPTFTSCVASYEGEGVTVKATFVSARTVHL